MLTDPGLNKLRRSQIKHDSTIKQLLSIKSGVCCLFADSEILFRNLEKNMSSGNGSWQRGTNQYGNQYDHRGSGEAQGGK